MAAEGWTAMTLGDFVTLQRGYDLPASSRRKGNVPIMGSGGLTGHHDTALARGPGITIGRSGVGSMGVVNFCPVDFWPHNTTLFVTDFHGNNERFAFYLLSSLDLRRFDSGSAQASLNRNYIYPMKILVPLFSEQEAIARTLSSLDDKIDLNRRMNQTLEAMAHALFKSWFVDFDTIGDSEPWLVNAGRVSDLALISKDALNPADYPEELFDHYSIPSFDEGRIAKVESGQGIKSNKFVVAKGSVLLSKLNPRIPRVWLPLTSKNRRSICSTEFLVLIPKGHEADREYIYSLCCSSEFAEELASRATGTSGSHQRVRPDDLMNIECPLPDREAREAFSRTVRPMFDKVAQNIEESRTLAALRDTLLPKLLSGEIRVKQAEKIVGEAV